MFYLLKDNRIIDSENYKEPYILSKDVIRNREVLFLTSFKDQVLVKGTIKKQSENVYDLIDLENDIVKYKFREEDIISKAVDASLSYIIGSYPEDVIAIYKPNSRGDYIKVWEKKMEV